MRTLSELSAELSRQLKPKIKQALAQDVAPVVKESIVQATRDTVYSYNPAVYIRRHELDDISNINATMIDDTTLHLRNDAPVNDFYPHSNIGLPLDAQVVQGVGYTWEGAFSQPRDFYGAAADELERSQAHVEALKNGLSRNGIQTDYK